MKPDKTTKLLLLMIIILLSFIAFRPVFSPNDAVASRSGSYSNIKFLGSSLAHSILLDTKTGNVWLLNWDGLDQNKLEWTRGGRFVDFGKQLSK